MAGRVQEDVSRLILEAVSQASPPAPVGHATAASEVVVDELAALTGVVTGLVQAVRLLAAEVDAIRAAAEN